MGSVRRIRPAGRKRGPRLGKDALQAHQSQVRDKNHMLATISAQLKDFSPEDYQRLTPLILEQSIPVVQGHILEKKLTYKELTQWFLYRIALYENDPNTMLNAVIAINPTAVEEARQRDKKRTDADHPIYGIPVLVKDNVNVAGMPASAGTWLLKDNQAPDAEIIQNIKAKGGIILGKTNLSEWANYLFTGGPNGFSAVGGQTLNAYGRRIYDTGGSSSGSGVSYGGQFCHGGHRHRNLRLHPLPLRKKLPRGPQTHCGSAEYQRHHSFVEHPGYPRPHDPLRGGQCDPPFCNGWRRSEWRSSGP